MEHVKLLFLGVRWHRLQWCDNAALWLMFSGSQATSSQRIALYGGDLLSSLVPVPLIYTLVPPAVLNLSSHCLPRKWAAWGGSGSVQVAREKINSQDRRTAMLMWMAMEEPPCRVHSGARSAPHPPKSPTSHHPPPHTHTHTPPTKEGRV